MQQVVLGNVVFNVAGEWDSGTAYPALSWVTHSGSSWYSTTDAAAGQEPGINAVWALGAQGMDFSTIPLATTDTAGIVRLALDSEITQGNTDIVPTAAQLAKVYLVGKIEFLPFRPDELPTGWYFCNGDQYPLASPQGEALDSLSSNFKADWGVTVSGDNISIPNMFYSDGRGYFLRAGTIPGKITNDQMRPITGSLQMGNPSYIYSLRGASGTIALAQESAYFAVPTQFSQASGASSCVFNSSLLGAAYNGQDTHPLERHTTPAILLGV